MKIFGFLLSAMGYGFGTWLAMAVMCHMSKVRRIRLDLRHVHNFMSRGEYDAKYHNSN